MLHPIYLKILHYLYKWKAILTILLISVPFLLTAQNAINSSQDQQFLNKSTKSQFFIENKGQWPKQVKFLARLGGMNCWITDSGVVYDYFRIDRSYSPDSPMRMLPHQKEEFERTHTSCNGQVVRMDFEGINLNAEKKGIDKKEAYYNYFIGNDSSKWSSFVGLYTEILVKDAYPGIDIRYYFDSSQIRYDYLVNPGADISQISFKLTGADDVAVNEIGELLIKTSLGEVRHGKLYAYQQSGNIKKEVFCRFERNKDGSFGVIASEYEKGLALVIDPLVWSTFLGGTSVEVAYSMILDNKRNVGITGTTYSLDYPTTSGSYDIIQNGDADIFVTLLNPTASSLIYSTFIGGLLWENPCTIIIDSLNDLYIAGTTNSFNFPTTFGAFDRVHEDKLNITYDGFVTKLNSSGSGLIYSTYIGGTSHENVNCLSIDEIGNAYITGTTWSADFPTTFGAYDLLFNKNMDCFITKLNPSGTALVYSTYIGGDDVDISNAIAIDKNHNVYITGYTGSANYPTTTGAYNQTINGTTDAFITELNSNGSALIFSTFIGGNKSEDPHSIVLDASKNIYISGNTLSYNYPTTSGTFNQNINGISDVFISKLNSSGTNLIASTLFGGNDAEDASSLTLDMDANVYLTGFTRSTNFPVTSNAIIKSFGGGLQDAYVTKMNPDLSALIYSSYLGGTGNDDGRFLTVDSNKVIFLTGYTESVNFPTTPGVYDQTFVNNEVFVVKLFIFTQAHNINFQNIACSQMGINWKKGEGKKRIVFMKEGNSGYPSPINNSNYNADTVFGSGSQIGSSGWFCVYNDIGPNVKVSNLKFNTIYRIMVLEVRDSGGIEIYVTDSAFNNPLNQKSGSLPLAVFHININQQILSGNNFVFSSAATTPKTNMKFYWDFGDGDTSTTSNPKHSYIDTGSYKVVMIATSDFGYADTFTDTVFVIKNPPMVVSFNVSNACIGDEVLFSNTSKIYPPDSFLNFLWDFGDGNTIVLKNPKHIFYTAGTYYVSLVALTGSGVKDTFLDTIEVYDDPVVHITATPDTIVVAGSPITITASGLYDQLLWSDNSTNGYITVNAAGIYWVIASYTNGCKSYDTITLTRGEIKAPEIVNVITPNDDGINDMLFIKNINPIKPCKLSIYNRWGDELYSTSDYQNNWEGTYKSKKLPEGTYYYVLKTRDGKMYRGAVNILR